MKAQFMMLWDGLSTDPENTVIVMGATNRPKDLDPAILRRMPSTFEISLPVKIYILFLIVEFYSHLINQENDGLFMKY